VAPRPEPFNVVFLGAPGVSYIERAPLPELAPWIAAHWSLHASHATSLRVLPDGCIDIIGQDVVGPFTQAVVFDLEPGDAARGIRLRPGAFSALFGIPASELVDMRVPLSDLIGRPCSLRDLAADAERPDPLAEAMMRTTDPNQLRRDSGYSERHLRRRLIAATGHGAKRLARIGRMQALLRAGRGESWARTAVEFGYFDEAHMVNDIRRLAGATPHRLVVADSSNAVSASAARMHA
jgi:AraC-like DNA-binding protein